MAGKKKLGPGEVEGFAGYLGEWDSKTGTSNNVLLEGGLAGGHNAPAYVGSSGGVAVNSQHFEPLLFAPVAGYGGLVASPSGVGVYAGTSFVGAGGYLNVWNNATCNQATQGHP